jgi:galactokinase
LVSFAKVSILLYKSARAAYGTTMRFQQSILTCLLTIQMNLDGVLGAKLTGAEFSGCIFNIIEADYVDEFIEEIFDRYFKRTAKACEIYLA